ncbi:rap1 gtpase-activating protein 1-like protein [Lasius niger]|uniref:Rap1 gtpase-activating protein 1-like protein n=1 Tax=Lasius niger TaxID=67767 RepID=A0A0J7L1F0_LASNI|nr:rap1 gtpase-activating protein 1-like protein [Lasius niger]
MRRPLTRHLSEGGGSGGGATADSGRQRHQRSSVKEGGDERGGGGYTWTCRDYSHHLSFGDLLKAPTPPPAECRGRAIISPEPRSGAIHR